MRTKVPPVAQFFIAALICWLVCRSMPEMAFHFMGQFWVAVVLSAFSLIIAVWELVAFGRAKTTVDPLKPEKASSLVISGIYKVSRNPMYLRLLLLLLAIGIYWGNPVNLAVVAFFVWYMNKYQIQPEEETMEAKFGESFRQYCRQTRRWI